jgi:hypothetical protein
MKNKTKKSPTGAPLGNPLKYFREGGEKRMAAYKKGGYNVPKNSLPRRDNGGPGSGMGRMAYDDAAFEAMLSENKPVVKPTVDYGSGPYGNTTPGPRLKDYGNQNTTPPDSVKMRNLVPPNFSPVKEGPFGNTTPGHIVSPLHWSKQKKGGSVKRKK